MNKTVARLRTERALRQTVIRHGTLHPASAAAYARFFVAWGYEAPGMQIDEQDRRVFLVATLRATNQDGYNNRSQRRHNKAVTVYR